MNECPSPRTAAGLVALAVVLLIPACRKQGPAASGTAGASTPDVILVTIDTLRADAVGFEGNARGTTPNLDRLAGEGRVFSFTHAHAVMTLPSHASILTGLTPPQHGIRDNAGFRLDARHPTMATRLKERGYTTAAFVSAFPLDSRYGLSRGFDVYREMYRSGEGTHDLRVPEASGETAVAAAMEWWKTQAAGPRFLWLHLYDPHAPYESPEPFASRYAQEPYLGGVAQADAALAPLLDAARGAARKPFLIVTADHGEALGDHGEITHGLFAYEATLRVPLLLWCPGLVAPGRDTGGASHVDLLPTVLAAVGAPAPAGLLGVSLLPGGPKQRGATYFEALSASLNRGWAPLTGILAGRRKYIDLPIPEVYDIAADPEEKANTAAGVGDDLRRMRRILLEMPSAPPDASRSEPGAEEVEKLRSLGYISSGVAPKASYGPEDDPKNLVAVDTELHRVVELYEKNQAGEAIALARRLVTSHPKMLLAHFQLASLLSSRGDVRAALQVYENAARQGLESEALDRRRALLLSEIGRSAEAARLLARWERSDNIETLNALGIARSDAGQPESALPVFERAMALDPGSVLTLQNRGMALLRLNRAAEARQSLEKALEVNPRVPRAWNALGVARMQTGDAAGAIAAWEKCVELNPKQYDALYNIALVAFRAGDMAKAKPAMERFLSTAPKDRYAKDLAEVREALAELKRRQAA
ncbi:MAG TPA: sulfatase-like hydrolase/transferase [Thermoanaerobaculia bacterium]